MPPTGHNGIGRYNEPGAVCWNELHTRDYQPAREFYTSVFGFSYTDIGDGSEFVYSTFERPKDGQTVAGISHDTNLPDGVPGYWLTWFQVQDPDATLQAAAALGAATILPPTDSPFGRMAILQGPQGETFGIINPPAQAGTTQES